MCQENELAKQTTILFTITLLLLALPAMYSSDISKSNKGKSQNRISLQQQRFLKNDKSEKFLHFYLVYKNVYLKVIR